jgi:hypothetical protein
MQASHGARTNQAIRAPSLKDEAAIPPCGDFLRRYQESLSSMRTNSPRLFDFAPRAAHYNDEVDRIRQFADHAAFQSATVQELELGDSVYRFPLRPEDLASVDFSTPTTENTVTRLASLASQRLLFAINALRTARLPLAGDEDSAARFARFYGERNQILGATIRPFLEDFAFDFLDDEGMASRIAADPAESLRACIHENVAFWQATVDRLAESDYLDNGLRFILLQSGCLAPVKRSALAVAAASGYFDLIPSAVRPQLDVDPSDRDIVARLAQRFNVKAAHHAHWQFYLSTSLAGCNLLHSLASRPDRALYLYGASFVAEAEWMATRGGMMQAATRLGVANGEARRVEAALTSEDLLNRFNATLGAVAARYGDRGLRQVASGLAAAATLAVSAKNDLREQLGWLASSERYRALAQRISARIETECPNIDRETFAEPREMCSTTHVHDDHRLVVIESGTMVLWGNLGMKMRLEPGEMVFVPQGRLHGSSIESDSCTYHQPIIPNAWIASLNSAPGLLKG